MVSTTEILKICEGKKIIYMLMSPCVNSLYHLIKHAKGGICDSHCERVLFCFESYNFIKQPTKNSKKIWRHRE